MKLWANSGDSHYMEPKDLYATLPPDMRERMPRSVKSADGTSETIHVDGASFERPLPRIGLVKGQKGRTLSELNMRAPGAHDFTARRHDLDEEGIWAEVIYPSVGLWNSRITDRVLAREAVKVINDWCAAVQRESVRHVIPAQISPLDIDDAVEEVRRAATLDLKAVSIPCVTPDGTADFNRPYWDPLWDTMEELGMVIANHGGSGEDPVHYHGPGAGAMNYVRPCIYGLEMAGFFASSGILDRRPGLKLLISEAGTSWVPFLGARLNEAFEQHAEFMRDNLSRSPKQILFDQVYTTFQHDETSIPVATAMGYRNGMWGSDYPHIEGTFGHTQKTLHELFDDQPDEVTYRITQGAFLELFPHVGAPPRQGVE